MRTRRIDDDDAWETDDDGNVVGVVLNGRSSGLNLKNLVTYEADPVTGGITKIWSGTQAEYDAIATPADDTLYIIVEA